jgi:hypothetical protein
MRRAPESLILYLSPYGQEINALYLETRKFVLEEAPGAIELIYDAYNAVSCVYSQSETLKDAFCHVVAYSDHVNLGFNRGSELPDPYNLLRGNGKKIRHIQIFEDKDLSEPGCKALVLASMKQSAKFASLKSGRGESIAKSVAKKKRRPE